jgi:membrane-associated protease RseP (regulator of RpoE activity)
MTDIIETPDVSEEIIDHEAPSPLDVPGLIRLLVVLSLIVGTFFLFGAQDLLLVIAALMFMVLFHELGHFATAKWSGMKVTQYFVGFGPRLWSMRRGETEYGVKAIPAGGYVRIIGMTSAEEVHPSDEPRAYRNQAFPKRILVASAGSFMHFVLAFVLAFLALTLIGRPDASVVTVQSYLNLGPTVMTPAQKAGLQPGDRIVSVNGIKVTSDAVLTNAVGNNVNKPITITVEKNGITKTKTITPLDGRTVSLNGAPLAPKDGPAKGFVGVQLAEGTTTVSPLNAIVQSGSVVRQAAVGAVTGITHLFSPTGLTNYARAVANPPTASSPAAAQASRPESIIGAVRTATQGVQAGMLTFVEVFISINIFIGVINMLPMLPLDGGHVVIAAYEWIRTRKGKPRYQADVTKMMPVVYAFVGLLLILVVSSMYLDVTHPAANPFR